MSYTPHGKHLIAGSWRAGSSTFKSSPATGSSHAFSVGTVTDIDDACRAAEEAFKTYGYLPATVRAEFLNAIADEIDARADAITQIGTEETGLPEGRLIGERGRTTGQLRLFAQHILSGQHLDRRHDAALPDRKPAPRPDIHLMQRPIGPVAVFGASNFPLAFSTAGGDTAAALAAGCPVVVKGHSAHPGTGEIVADAIDAARQKLGLHPGVFSFVQGGNREVGAALVQHPMIKAVGFTGSLRGGRALFDLCAARPEPIPFFGELGSINPMFLLPHAVEARGAAIGAAWADSLVMGAGQFCTNPGVAFAIEGAGVDTLLNVATEKLRATATQTMLTDDIASAYHRGVAEALDTASAEILVRGDSGSRNAAPAFIKVSADTWRANTNLAHEVFGPFGIAVVVRGADEMLELARAFEGQLTATLHLDSEDMALAKRLLPVLERKAGRVLANGFPTGVEVCDAMVHGGPYPASTNFGATSVGTLSIRRFLRPVSYQNLPEALVAELDARA
ncbi:aldehyde dehydrogenase (NADP(+)) [Mesorhizobium sp. KR2-14]|uniref:aldehyde dehydrogenase (NADP(+)) n=1 Tax=Mesorhizobium sp. KR2-14 TaxID=3156610 RepID=UPI0032B49E94